MYDNSLNCVAANDNCGECTPGNPPDCGGGKALLNDLSFNPGEEYYVLVHSASGNIGGQFEVAFGSKFVFS